jgi:hypothetical protein
LSAAISRSPWKHLDLTDGLVVVGGGEDLERFVGMVVLRSISR